MIAQHYSMGDGLISVEVHGEKLAFALEQPLRHLKTDPVLKQDLKIEIWDEKATGRTWVWPEPAKGLFCHEVHSTKVVFDRQNKEIKASVTDAENLSDYELGRPLHQPLSLWLRDRGLVVVHAATVADKGHGILLAGPSGSGKSTTAQTCCEQGMSFLSEDLTALDSNGVAHSLYRSFYRGDEQHKILSFAEFDTQIKAELKAIVLPRVANQNFTQASPVPQIQALLELGPWTALMGRARAGKKQLEMLGDLVARIPAFRVELGTDADELMRSLRSIIS